MMRGEGSSIVHGFCTVVLRDLRIAFRQPGEMLNPVIFFLMVVTIMPLGVSANGQALALLAPGLLWVIALLASLLSLDTLFRSDYEDGSLELIILSSQPLYFMVMAKVLAHWLSVGLPLAIFSPLLGVLLSLPAPGYWPLCVSLLLGTLVLSFLGAIGAALTVSLRKGGLLLSLITLPLYVPVLIFGASAVTMAVAGWGMGGAMAMLAAFAALALVLAPLAIAGALKISVQG